MMYPFSSTWTKLQAESKANVAEATACRLIKQLSPSLLTSDELVCLIMNNGHIDAVGNRRILNALDSCAQNVETQERVACAKRELATATRERKAAAYAARTLVVPVS